MKRKMSYFVLSILLMFVMTVVAYAAGQSYVYYNASNNYGYSPVGNRIVVGATGTATGAKTTATLMSTPSTPAFQYLYVYVSRRQYQTIIESKQNYQTIGRGNQLATGLISRNPSIHTQNIYHEAKCFDHTNNILDPSVGMTNLYEEYKVTVYQQ